MCDAIRIRHLVLMSFSECVAQAVRHFAEPAGYLEGSFEQAGSARSKSSAAASSTITFWRARQPSLATASDWEGTLRLRVMPKGRLAVKPIDTNVKTDAAFLQVDHDHAADSDKLQV
jgi:hypothetical protein